MLIKDTWGHYLENIFQENLKQIAVIDIGRNARYTYRDLLIQTKQFEKAFIGYGIQRGMHVALVFPSSATWISVFLALIHIGAVPVCVNNDNTDGEIRHTVMHSDSRMIITDEETYVKVRLHENEMDLRQIVIVDRRGYCSEELHCTLDTFLAHGEYVTDEMVQEACDQVRYDDILTIQYTSGTTGLPKAVMSVHYKVLNNILRFKDIFKYTNEDKVLTSLPMYHVMGCFFTCLLTFMVGGSLVLMSRFNTKRAIQAIVEEECTSFHGVPTMFKLIMNKMGDSEFPTLKKGMIAGSYCEPEAMEDIINKMGMKYIMPLYGQSEGSGYTQIRIGDPIEKVLTTVGRPIEGITVKIVDNQCNEVPQGVEGEIWIQSDYTMAGYYKDQEATDKVIVEGWIHTGDLGKVDEEGYVVITGRKKDIIIRGGENISPVDIESILRQHEYVRDVVVVGVEDKIMGQEVGACIIVDDKAEEIEENVIKNCIIEHAQKNLAKYKVPKYIEFVKAFPLTGSGKIQKTKLAQTVFG